MCEKCARCGEMGEDRRTLWMACFYQMNEMDVPFVTDILFQNAKNKDVIDIDIVEEKGSIKLPNGVEIDIVPPKLKINDVVFPREMYTLRVCKRCRAEWMEAIGNWFKATPQHEDGDADEPDKSSVGSGIFVRCNGHNMEITEEEWYKMNPGREPTRVVSTQPGEGDEN